MATNRYLLMKNWHTYYLLAILLAHSLTVSANAAPYRIAFTDIIEFNPEFLSDAEIALQQQIENDNLPLPKEQRQPSSSGNVSVAIIIDDLGYNYEQGIKAIQLPGAITYAIIPYSPKADFFALEAQKNNKEVILHAPMSTVNHAPLGKNGLTEFMNEMDFKQALNQSLASLPNIKGMNNHMGSLLTQKPQAMEWVMQSLQQHQLYFIDSRTTADSVAWKIAQQYNIPSLKRDVFLDHEPTSHFIDKQFKQLIAIARRQGYAIGIGHPHPETIEYLQRHLASLDEQNITLVSASTLALRFSPNQLSLKSAEKM